MAKLHRVSMNGQVFPARSGQVILEAAMVSGVDMPHDCRAGRCGTCVTQLTKGITLGGDTAQRGMVLACQARVFSDLSLLVEALPVVKRIEARLEKVIDLTPDVVELTIAPVAPLDLLHGQYCHFTFRGFPTRTFSPTAPLDGQPHDSNIRLNVKRVRDGRVSSNLGGTIKAGHRLSVEGPLGHAFLRPGCTNRLVLVAGGTGFAPVWAIGEAALREDWNRHVVFVAGAAKVEQLYMAPALKLAANFPNVKIIMTADATHPAHPNLRVGRPHEHIPALTSDDIVYACGAPAMVDAAAKLARAAHATFYSDPFAPAVAQSEGWLTRGLGLLRRG
jgi:CDP-4-dehydro-6-deoxyglucose reductase, E3